MYFKAINRLIFTEENEKTLNFKNFYKYLFYLFAISGIFTSFQNNIGTGNRNARYMFVKMRNFVFNMVSILPFFACLSYIIQPSSISKKR